MTPIPPRNSPTSASSLGVMCLRRMTNRASAAADSADRQRNVTESRPQHAAELGNPQLSAVNCQPMLSGEREVDGWSSGQEMRPIVPGSWSGHPLDPEVTERPRQHISGPHDLKAGIGLLVTIPELVTHPARISEIAKPSTIEMGIWTNSKLSN